MEIIEDFNKKFGQDVIEGLSKKQKSLPSKYFYDAKGDKLFQEIMAMPSYYLTNVEFAIFEKHKAEILKAFLGDEKSFRLVELGAGDGTKTKVLMQYFLSQGVDFTYSPIDISGHVLAQLKDNIQGELPNLKIESLEGDYFDALAELNTNHNMKEVVFFLGSTIGNFERDEVIGFIKKLGGQLNSGDLLFLGVDLMKDPKKILAAYNDEKGITKAFNLNLLSRMNKELGANFNIEEFDHFPTYDPITGETKSYLVSRCEQKVFFAHLNKYIHFKAWEPIYMEISQKFSFNMLEDLAENTDFKIVANFEDLQVDYVNTVWEKK